MEPLEVFALSAKRERMTGSIPYLSLQWRRRYYESGWFEMEIPETVYNPDWAYIYTDERHETGVIQKVEYRDTQVGENGIDTIMISGFFMEEWLNAKTFLLEEAEEEVDVTYKNVCPLIEDPYMGESGQTAKVYKHYQDFGGTVNIGTSDIYAADLDFLLSDQIYTQTTDKDTEDLSWSKRTNTEGNPNQYPVEPYEWNYDIENGDFRFAADGGFFIMQEEGHFKGDYLNIKLGKQGSREKVYYPEWKLNASAKDVTWNAAEGCYEFTESLKQPYMYNKRKWSKKTGQYEYNTDSKTGALKWYKGTENTRVTHRLYPIEHHVLPNAYYFWGDDSVSGNLVVSILTEEGVSESKVIYSESLARGEASLNKKEVFYWADETGINGMQESEEGAMLWLASGIVNSWQQSYAYKPKMEVDEESRVPVKGPWQLTDFMDPETEMDNVQHLMQWAQFMYGNTFIWEEPTFGGEVKVINPSFKRMGDVLYDELQTIGASFQVEYNFEYDKLAFRIWRGKDRTQSQSGNPWSVFSDSWGTVYGYSESIDTSNYRNKCYVLYDYEQPKEWNDDGTPKLSESRVNVAGEQVLLGWYIEYEKKRGYSIARIQDGLPDKEVYLDRRSDKPEPDKDWKRDMYPVKEDEENDGMPTFEEGMREKYEAFESGITESGKNLLVNSYGVVTQLDTGTVDTSGYLEDFDLGDKVDLAIGKIGVMVEERIIGVDEVYTAGRSTVKLVIGEELVSDAKKARII